MKVRSFTETYRTFPLSDEIELFVNSMLEKNYVLISHVIVYHPNLDGWFVNYIFRSE